MLKLLTTVFNGLQGYLIVAIVVGLGAAAGGYYVAHKAGEAKIAALELRMATASVKAVKEAAEEQQRLDRIGLDAALALGKTTLAIEVGTVKLVTEIEHHVKVTSIPCVPYGLIRVLDAAVLGYSAESLALPAGQSDDSCALVDAQVLAKSIASNYGTANANAAQLDALSAYVRAVQLSMQEHVREVKRHP